MAHCCTLVPFFLATRSIPCWYFVSSLAGHCSLQPSTLFPPTYLCVPTPHCQIRPDCHCHCHCHRQVAPGRLGSFTLCCIPLSTLVHPPTPLRALVPDFFFLDRRLPPDCLRDTYSDTLELPDLARPDLTLEVPTHILVCTSHRAGITQSHCQSERAYLSVSRIGSGPRLGLVFVQLGPPRSLLHPPASSTQLATAVVCSASQPGTGSRLRLRSP